MNRKQWIGVCVAVVGILVTGFAVHAMSRINRAKKGVGFLTKPFSGNPTGKTVTSKLQDEVSQYDNEVRLLLVGGIALILVGCGAVYYLRK